jgi:hypothetical protein
MAQSGEGDCAIFFGTLSVLRQVARSSPPSPSGMHSPVAIRVPYDQAATSRSSAGLSWMVKIEFFSSIMSFFLNPDSMRVIVSRLVPVS